MYVVGYSENRVGNIRFGQAFYFIITHYHGAERILVEMGRIQELSISKAGFYFMRGICVIVNYKLVKPMGPGPVVRFERQDISVLTGINCNIDELHFRRRRLLIHIHWAVATQPDYI